MYRLLIVDDEEIIVNGLHEIFSGLKELDLDVYKAYSGEEAIDWLRRTRIDVVLTDINMPEIDGLQLLEEIKRSWPQCRVIFLTGHSEFEYIYQAIHHPGVNYILKTEEYEKIIGTVEKAIEDIRLEIKTEDMVHKAKEQMNMAIELFQKDYFLHLLNGDVIVGEGDNQFEKLETPMKADWPVFLLLGCVESLPSKQSYWEKLQHLYSIRQVIGRYFAAYVNISIVMNESYQFVLLVQPKESLFTSFASVDSEPYYQKTFSFLRGTLESIQTACREKMSASISFIVGDKQSEWRNIAARYQSLVQLSSYRIGSGIESVLVDNEIKSSIINERSSSELIDMSEESEYLDSLLRHKSMRTLEYSLETGQQEEYFAVLAELIDPMKKISSKNDPFAIEAYYTISLAILSYINKWKLTNKVAFHIGQNKLMRIDLFDSWAEATGYLWDISGILFRIQAEDQSKRADNAINYLQKFIKTHLDEDLSLVRLAEQVYLNPSYLSRLYKQTTGQNLSEYIDSARSCMAKLLLANNQLRIHEVASSVGYDTAASFSRFFRKMTGISPQEFRESMIAKQLNSK